MGVLMVRKEVKRGTSLLMGISVALLLGAAATFLVLALPQHMLEGLTTTVGLSRIMVQAEPPISPNDRVLLAVLAGLGTAGIGWVLVDWLLFGRVGISAIIRPREDDYEDEDDLYRPSNPLDLVSEARSTILPTPVNLSSDPRRPLSARTDIGDPPAPSSGVVRPDGDRRGYDIGADPFLPPLDQLLPEASGAGPSRGEAAAIVPPPSAGILPPLELTDVSSLDMPDIPMRAPTPGPLIFPTAAEIAAGTISSGTATSTLPPTSTPVPDPVILPEPEAVAPPAPAWSPPPAPAAPPPITVEIEPTPPAPPPAPPPLRAPAVSPDPQDRFASFPPDLPDLAAFDTSFLMPPANAAPIPERPASDPPAPPPTPAPPPVAPPPAPVFETPIFTPPPAPVAPPPPVTAPAPVASRPAASVAGAPLEDLLARLEQGMHKRRPAPPQFAAPSAVEPVAPPDEPVRRPLPAYASAPDRMVNVPPAPPALAPVPPVVQAAPPAPEPAPVVVPEAPAAYSPLSPTPESPDGLLDQPLHVALDVLRNRVRRSG
jgi:hypothetical protein